MKGYRVAVCARLLIDVEAESDEKARQKAEKIIRDEGDLETYWTEDVWSENDPFIIWDEEEDKKGKCNADNED